MASFSRSRFNARFSRLAPTYHLPSELDGSERSSRRARTALRCVAVVLGLVHVLSLIISWPLRQLLCPVLPRSLQYYFNCAWDLYAALGVWGLTFAERVALHWQPRIDPGDVASVKKAVDSAARFVAPTLMHGVPAPTSPRPRLKTAAEYVVERNNLPFCMVHGVFGWGEGERMPSYWGGAELLDRRVFAPSLGPVSSHHTRAVELFYQLKGGTVDYGEEHSRRVKSARYGETFDDPLYPEWSSSQPLHLVGHSMGGDTARTLQHLLARKDFFPGHRTSEDWIKSITCVSTPLNGTPCCDFLGLKSDLSGVRWGSLLHLLVTLVTLGDLLSFGWLGREVFLLTKWREYNKFGLFFKAPVPGQRPLLHLPPQDLSTFELPHASDRC